MRVGIVFEYEELVLVRRVLALLHLSGQLKSWRALIGSHMRLSRLGLIDNYPDFRFNVFLPMNYAKFRKKYIKKKEVNGKKVR